MNIRRVVVFRSHLRQISLPTVLGWVGLVVAACSALLHLPIGLNNDTITLMHQTRKMMQGGQAYVDFIEINPPLINFLLLVPWSLADLTGLAPAHALNVCAVILGVGSLWLCGRLLGQHPHRIPILASLALGLFSISFLHQLFADREYLMTAFMLPLLLLYSPYVDLAATGRTARLMAASMAGIGIALKPYAACLYVAACLYRIGSSRRIMPLLREPEPYVMGGICSVYGLLVWTYFPVYVDTILPFFPDTYAIISWSWEMKWQAMKAALLAGYGAAGLVCALLLLLLAPSHYHRGISYLLLLLLGSLGSYVLSAGWYYTQYPFIVISWLLAVSAGKGVLLAASGQSSGALRRTDLVLMGSGILISVWMFYLQPIGRQASWDLDSTRRFGHPVQVTLPVGPAYVALERLLDQYPRYLWLDFSVWAGNMQHFDGARTSVGRFDYLWPLPGLLRLQGMPDRKADYERLLSWFAGGIAEDIVRRRPDVVIIDASPDLINQKDIMSHLSDYLLLAQAMASYQEVQFLDYCSGAIRRNCAYRIYTRSN